MIELVVPEDLSDSGQLEDERLSACREMVGREVFSFDGSLEDAKALANELSEDSREPVLVNDVTDQTDEHRIVDVYMHQGGQERSVSEGVERPRNPA